MSRQKDLAKLRVLADLMLDHHLSDLKKAADTKAQSEAALARLAQIPDASAGLEGMSGPLAALAYQRWADAQRGRINQQIALQTAVWIEARDTARTAFGKAEALRKLSEKHSG